MAPTVPCRFFNGTPGSCRYGDSCSFSHSIGWAGSGYSMQGQMNRRPSGDGRGGAWSAGGGGYQDSSYGRPPSSGYYYGSQDFDRSRYKYVAPKKTSDAGTSGTGRDPPPVAPLPNRSIDRRPSTPTTSTTSTESLQPRRPSVGAKKEEEKAKEERKKSKEEADLSSIFSAFSSLSLADRAAFEAEEFTLGSIPLVPPPRELSRNTKETAR